jgi:phosphinothricin acetyltransferase
MRIREARIEDVDAVTQIYNDAVLNTVATFDTHPKTISEQERWFAEHDSKNPILVAEEDGLVLGWASLSRWSDRCGYCDTSEISVYVRTGYRGKGIGRSLVERVLEAAEEAGLHTVIARITASRESSIRLFESLGFIHVGTLREVGRKFDMLLDVHLMQRVFDN